MDRADTARQAVLRHHGDAPGLGAGQRRIGGDCADAGVAAAGAVGERAGSAAFRHRYGAFGGRAGIDFAEAVDRDQRADAVAGRQGGRNAADAARAAAGAGAISSAEATAGVAAAQRCVCRAGEVAIGWFRAPGLVAAVGEIEQYRCWHHRDARQAGADVEALARRCQQQHQFIGRRQPVDRPSGERETMDAFDQRRRVEGIGFAGAGAAAAHIDRHHHGLCRNDDGHAGVDTGVMGMSNGKAGHVREAICHAAL